MAASARALQTLCRTNVRALRRKVAGWEEKISSRIPTNRKHGRFALADEFFVGRWDNAQRALVAARVVITASAGFMGPTVLSLQALLNIYTLVPLLSRV